MPAPTIMMFRLIFRDGLTNHKQSGRSPPARAASDNHKLRYNDGPLIESGSDNGFLRLLSQPEIPNRNEEAGQQLDVNLAQVLLRRNFDDFVQNDADEERVFRHGGV